MDDILCDAIRKVIDEYGIDVLKSPKLTNILLDYGAFKVHDKNAPIKKVIIAKLVSEGYGEKLIRWKKKRGDWKSKHDDFINAFKGKNKIDHGIIDEVINAFVNGTGLIDIAVPKKQKKISLEFVFGKKIVLEAKDRYEIIAGGITVLLIVFLVLRSQIIGSFDSWARSSVVYLLFMVVHPLVFLQDKNTHKPEMGVYIACALGGMITWAIPALIEMSYGDYTIEVIVLVLYLCMFISYSIGRFKAKLQWRLFGYIFATILLLLIIIVSIPLFVKQSKIHYQKKVCKSSLILRAEHMKHNIDLGFMGVRLDDYYPNVVQQLNHNPNVDGFIHQRLKEYSYSFESTKADIDVIDIDHYRHFYYTPYHRVELEFDKKIQCDVSFDNERGELSLFFYQDSVKYIQFNGVKEELYVNKYGLPEYYFKSPPKWFVSRIDEYPYFDKIDYQRSGFAQWTYANGVIRVDDKSAYYISNDVFDTIIAMDERAKRAAERLRLEQETRERQLKLEKERQEKEVAKKEAEEQRKREEAHKQAMEQI